MFPDTSIYSNPKWVHPRACPVCKYIKCKCDAEEIQMRIATCSICTLAPVMRHCSECRFAVPVQLVVAEPISLVVTS